MKKHIPLLTIFLVTLTTLTTQAYVPYKIENLDSIKPFDDVRWKDLSKIDASIVKGIQDTLWFDRDIVCSDELRDSGEALIQQAMNPGLGIRELHKQGITGKGVKLAIIDRDLCGEHPEFAGKFIQLKNFPDRYPRASMHGPAVASLLVGTNCGTAPDAKLYYAACSIGSNDQPDATPMAQALAWIVETNRMLPESDKIRVVSISAAPIGAGSPFTVGNKEYDTAFQRAIKAGILVLDCSTKYGFICPGYLDMNAPEDVSKVTPGFRNTNARILNPSAWLFVPSSPRTTAELYVSNEPSYQYTGQGGLSWCIPYVAGVLALGWQVNPRLSKEQILKYLWKSAYVKDGCKIINPPEFIRMVSEGVSQ